jgi:hypothetical protein
MAQLSHRPESIGGIVRGLALGGNFETEAGPEDSDAARQGRHTGFGDAEYAHTHRHEECKTLASAPFIENKRLHWVRSFE